jgi:hypothetical protein
MTKKCVCGAMLFSLLMLFVGNVIAQSNDVKGWGKTTWGMSEQEIIRLYPEAKRFKPDILHINNLPIGNVRCLVVLMIGGSKLREVTIGVPREEIKEGQFEEFQKALSPKYGPPMFTNQKHGGLPSKLNSSWTLPSTIIELEYTKLAGRSLGMKDYESLLIKYRPNASKDNL